MHIEQVGGAISWLCERPWVRKERRIAKRKMRPNAYRRHLKRYAKRYMRRAAKAQLDDAPTKMAFRGWEY